MVFAEIVLGEEVLEILLVGVLTKVQPGDRRAVIDKDRHTFAEESARYALDTRRVRRTDSVTFRRMDYSTERRRDSATRKQDKRD